jgi:hypothetical protein
VTARDDRSRGWRRWVAGAAFVLAVGLLASRTCQSEVASAEIRFLVGGAGAELQRLDVELYRPGDAELVGFYRRTYERGSGPDAGRWRLRADSGMYRAEIALRSRAGTTRVERALEIQDRAIITIDLEPDLAGR